MPPYLSYVFNECWHIPRDEVEHTIMAHSDLYMDLPLTADSSFHSIRNMILTQIGADTREAEGNASFLAVLIDGELIHIDDLDIPLKSLWQYVDREKNLCIRFIFSDQQGDVFREGNLRFYIHSNEQGHNTPACSCSYRTR